MCASAMSDHCLSATLTHRWFLFLLVLPLSTLHAQSIIYSIVRYNESNDGSVHSPVPTITSTTTWSTFPKARLLANETTVLQATDASQLKILVRSKRHMQKMPRPPKLDPNPPRNADMKDSSKNISLVLADLLDNYDYNQRPGYGGLPAVITTNLEIRSMGPISELDMEYSLDCYFRQKWKDQRLRFTGITDFFSLNIKMLDKIWKPDTYFHTGKGSHLHMITTPNKFLRIHKDGFVLYSMRLTIKSLCPMDLHSFPMDKQSCPLILGSYGYPNDQLLYQWDVQPVTLYNKDSNSLSQFDIFKTISRNKTFVFKRGNYSMLQVNFNLRRHVGYFLIQIYVPCSLIVVLSWVSFWINREATADRVGLGVTAVLTLSTFGLDSRSDLPRVSYATALDWYTIMCFLFVVFTLLEFAGVHYFTKVGTGEVPIIEIDDNWSRSSEEEESTPSEDRLPVVATRHRPTHRMERSVTNTRYRRSCKSFARKKLRHRLTGNHRKTFQISHQYEMQYPANSFNANQHFQHVDQRSKLRPWNCKTLNHSRDASFHMPYCPHSPEYQEYLGWEPAVSKNALAPSGCDDFSRMSYLENYLAKRLKNSSNMSLVYPAHNQNNFSSFDESSLKLNSSWPTLAWAKLPAWHSDRSKWLSEAESDDLEAVEKNGEECSEESGASQMWLMWRRLLHDLSQCCIQFWYCFTVNEQYKQEMKRRRTKGIAAVNSVSRIDKVSRIFFPFVFLVLNLFYWTFYINERNTDFNQWE